MQNLDKSVGDKHFVFVIGTRAQLIKMAPVLVEFEKRSISCTVLMTGQHKDTIEDIFREFKVWSPRIYVVKAKENATIFSLMFWLPSAYRKIIKELKLLACRYREIDVLVHGDTLSTFLGALAANKIGARTVHLESGLTSCNILDPFPEEILRRLVFRFTDVAMCPDDNSFYYMKNRFPKCEVVSTKGNTILDAIKISGVSRLEPLPGKEYIVVSIHRFQNIYKKERVEFIVKSLENISISHKVFFVLHPATRRRLEKSKMMGKLERNENIELLPRLGYYEFLKLAAGSSCVLTDGGSNQEELAALGVPTIIMRLTTERSDGIGENIIMENNINMGLVSYIHKKEYKNLERKRKMTNSSPSREIANALTESR